MIYLLCSKTDIYERAKLFFHKTKLFSVNTQIRKNIFEKKILSQVSRGRGKGGGANLKGKAGTTE